MARIKSRSRIAKKNFAVKKGSKGGRGKYPITDKAHARNALSRVSQFGTPAEKRAVARKVKSKFPALAKRSTFIKRVLGK